VRVCCCCGEDAQTVPMVEVDSGCFGGNKESSRRRSMDLQARTALTSATLAPWPRWLARLRRAGHVHCTLHLLTTTRLLYTHTTEWTHSTVFELFHIMTKPRSFCVLGDTAVSYATPKHLCTCQVIPNHTRSSTHELPLILYNDERPP
jgi:hypothetical protein